jgi:hypothetical protein
MTKCDVQWILLFVFAGLLAQPVFASNPAISDASLQDGGVLFGQLVDQQGIPRKAVQVVLRQGQHVVAATKTDSLGRFSISGLRAGVYQIETAQGEKVYRLWSPTTAPPAAQQNILMVTANDVVRGQIDLSTYGPAVRGAIAGGLITGLTYWALDHNDEGS